MEKQIKQRSTDRNPEIRQTDRKKERTKERTTYRKTGRTHNCQKYKTKRETKTTKELPTGMKKE